MGESGGGSSGRVEIERGRNLDESFNLHYGGIIMNREIVGSKSSLTTFMGPLHPLNTVYLYRQFRIYFSDGHVFTSSFLVDFSVVLYIIKKEIME